MDLRPLITSTSLSAIHAHLKNSPCIVSLIICFYLNLQSITKYHDKSATLPVIFKKKVQKNTTSNKSLLFILDIQTRFTSSMHHSRISSSYYKLTGRGDPSRRATIHSFHINAFAGKIIFSFRSQTVR